MTTLDFCASCGVILQPFLVAGSCDNCNANIIPREARAQGTFSDEDAAKLMWWKREEEEDAPTPK